MSLIRHRQRAQTAILPHSKNRRILVPNRGPWFGGGPPLDTVGVKSLTTTILFTPTSAFNPSSQALNDQLGYLMEIDVPPTPTNIAFILTTAGGSTGLGGANGIQISGPDIAEFSPPNSLGIGNNNTATTDQEPIGESTVGNRYKIDVRYTYGPGAADMTIEQAFVNDVDILRAQRVVTRESQVISFFGRNNQITPTLYRLRIDNYTQGTHEEFLVDEGSGNTLSPTPESDLVGGLGSITVGGVEGVDFEWVS